jgi:hypothetical protein
VRYGLCVPACVVYYRDGMTYMLSDMILRDRCIQVNNEEDTATV